MNFDLDPGAYRYRPLKLATPRHKGWDVYALQTALNGVGGKEIAEDGIFGRATWMSVNVFQAARGLEPDGIAGIATQQKLTSVLARKFRKGWQLPTGVPFGHLEYESSCLLGNHTAPYEDGKRDCGVAQRNTNYTTTESAFDAPASVHALCERITDYRAKYGGWGVPDKRALELACGSWNAPAWTDKLARGESLSEPYRQRIEAYMAAVLTYTR